ncbi:transcription factor domain-containing protein [Aspergillus mulundensis]|uniref:Putative Zn(II)2Cys6 transcription factor n=1 Tax=Aspergillus mulundensis TaxID=1810919 RepID=A0A3D8R528_9EURO|nr:putative Zn(II)2Cys6 transcription factor [Aspergillus mulundensis]RDW69031.1 putative Zn(II)2Cys6 transcription factor [Aspergillus mulundensis]
MCHKKKIKCEFDESAGTCMQCMRRNQNCKILSGGEKHKRSRYVRGLEERLRKTEALLRAAGLSVETADFGNNSSHSEDETEDDNSMDGEDVPPSLHQDFVRNAESENTYIGRAFVERHPPKPGYPDFPSDRNALTKPHERRRSATKGGPPVYKVEKGNSLYYGRSSPLSILTREGVEWIKKRSGEGNSLNSLLSNSNSNFDSPWAQWRPDVFHDLFASKVFKPLPPRAEVFSLLQDYFRTVNLIFPLYHEKTFMQLVEWQYTQQACDDAARWASINIMLALAYEYRFSNSQKSEKDREKAWLYYKNALSVFPELVLRRTDLLSVQALLGMAIFLRGNSGSQATMPIVTAAIRASHRMGLHRENPRPHLSKLEQQQRRNVFWIAYIIDQSISIRLGSAPTQQLDDYDVDFPSEETEGLMIVDNKSVFPQICRVSVIRSRTYKHFYSARGLENKSTAEICETVHKLHADLQDWKRNSQFEALLRQRGSGEDFLAGFASAGLFLIYNNTLMMIHRIPMLMNFVYQSRTDSVPQIDMRLILNQSASSAIICVQAARDILKSINHLPWGDVAWIWSLLYYVFLAVMTVFANILRNSQQPAAKDDLQSLNMAATFFATLVPADGPCNYARFMTRMSTTFERIARTVLEREQKTIRPGADPDGRGKASKTRGAHSTQATTTSQTQPQAQFQSTSTSTSVNIPNLEGLPPINSSGYVVPESPTSSPSQTPPPLSSGPSNTFSTRPPPYPHTSNPPNINQYQSTLRSQQPPYTSSTFHTNTATATFSFPTPTDASTTAPFTFPLSQPGPDLWQIPLTADWEFGFEGQFLGMGMGMNMDMNMGNMFPQQGFPYQGPGSETMGMNSAAATTAVPVSSVPVSVPTMMNGTVPVGYGYGSENQSNGGPASTSGPGPQSQPPMWFGDAF